MTKADPILLWHTYRHIWIFRKNMRNLRALGILKHRKIEGQIKRENKQYLLFHLKCSLFMFSYLSSSFL